MDSQATEILRVAFEAVWAVVSDPLAPFVGGMLLLAMILNHRRLPRIKSR